MATFHTQFTLSCGWGTPLGLRPDTSDGSVHPGAGAGGGFVAGLVQATLISEREPNPGAGAACGSVRVIDMRLTVMLCDHAEVADGKPFINGGAWDQIPPRRGPTMLVHVPWDNIQRTPNHPRDADRPRRATRRRELPTHGLAPKQGYTWRITLDNDKLGRVSFRTRAG